MFRSEFEFVRWLARLNPRRGGRVQLGIGDDAALIRVRRGQEMILTTDLSIEGVHFTRALHPPRSVGHRALARSLSDIAAMGGTPRFALVSLALTKRTTRAWVESFYAGLMTLAKRFGLVLIGGDTALVSSSTAVDVIVAGEVERSRALRRSSARPGDQIYVSGRLGLAALGLRFLKRGARVRHLDRGRPWRDSTTGAARQAVQAHLYPEPLCALGRFLSEKRFASSAIDISDGLSTDLAHLCEASGVGARVWANRIPRPEVRDAARSSREAPLDLALHGGEDYQLLFTVPPRKTAKVPARFRGVPLQRIGEIRQSKELLIIRSEGEKSIIRPLGYDHFRKRV